MTPTPRIARVYVFSNGMAMVFDNAGQQMREYQGYWDDVKRKILADKPPDVHIENRDWRWRAS